MGAGWELDLGRHGEPAAGAHNFVRLIKAQLYIRCWDITPVALNELGKQFEQHVIGGIAVGVCGFKKLFFDDERGRNVEITRPRHSFG